SAILPPAMHTLDRLRLTPSLMQNVVAWERLPARPARYGPWPEALDPRLAATAQARGLAALYTHQSLAVAAALRGENVVVVTGTASGKTLCYNLPVLHTLLAEPQARALYLFPTKALAQDQAAELSQFMQALARHDPAAGALAVRTYDGDTPQGRRAAIRQQAGVVISNPDMLHTGILPHHPRWADLFANLQYVVLDEVHTYRGVFGSHMANVIRRLRRVCAFYGSAPRFICASATIANPQDLAQKLIGAPVTLVPAAADGAPRAEKAFLVYNPPLTDPALGLRRSYLLEAQRLAGEFLADGVQTALFARTRHATEVLLMYVRDAAQQAGRDPQAVRGYRGGYLPLERRAIEQGLRSGVVRGVVATNALELGVDIGQLGAVVMAGYPGTIASLGQQAGRAGRRAESSAVVLVASASPLDQYLAAHPRYLFESSPEHALINPDNLALLVDHLRCAAFELPFVAGEGYGAFGDVGELLQALADEGALHASNGEYRWVGDAYPAAEISLRMARADHVLIQTGGGATEPAVIGEVDRDTAPIRVHTGAVYLHEGRGYVVDQLDWEAGLAHVHAEEVDYFTQASEAVELEVLNVFDAHEAETLPAVEAADPDAAPPLDDWRTPLDAPPPAPAPAGRAPRPPLAHSRAWGELMVTSQAASYKLIKRYTHETLGYGEITLPARQFQTTGYWLWLPSAAVRALAADGILVGPNNYGPNWESQRNAARARDGFRCVQCGAAEGGEHPTFGRRQHAVHHLVPFRSFGYIPGVNENYRQANELDNLQTLCHACHNRVESGRGTQTALGGLGYALGNLAPLFLMCDPRDLGVLSENRARETQAPTITLYDHVPEGLGFAERLYELHLDLLAAAHDLVRDCPCRDGCPACVGPVGLEAADTKALTQRLAARLIGK
ncbi:MAG: DEAD/DEAH box helicase, partial [Anaerolineales bacterium]|nr:DEAD/DEAH box helicase [Anaerolineales bacterium]